MDTDDFSILPMDIKQCDENDDIISCLVCGKTDMLMRCSACKTAFYCSRSCQVVDWSRHCEECVPYSQNLTTTAANNGMSNVMAIDVDESSEFDDDISILSPRKISDEIWP